MHFFKEDGYNEVRQHARFQTRSLIGAMSMYIGFVTGNRNCGYNDTLLFDKAILSDFLNKIESDMNHDAPEITNYPGLEQAFNAVCHFCSEYQQHKGPLLVSSTEVEMVLEPLGILQDWAEQCFESFTEIPFTIRTARGAGWFPRVPWLCILPPGQTVNDGIYVAICFGREGA